MNDYKYHYLFTTFVSVIIFFLTSASQVDDDMKRNLHLKSLLSVWNVIDRTWKYST
jgi:hypothetical protein